MPQIPPVFRAGIALLPLIGLLSSGTAEAQTKPAATESSPWGVSASSSSFKDRAHWFPKMAEAGVTTVRLFPEWRSFEPTAGTWTWNDGDVLLKSANENSLAINAILMGSPPGSKSVHAFPMENLDDWSRYVTAVVGRYWKQVRHWEVWNEGNGGFNDGHHTTADYAKLAVVTYAAAKKADPQAKIGLTVASFDAPYLHQTLLAMAKAGQPNSFDYLCIHPYEIADGLVDPDGEVPFLWMSHTLRGMLKATVPEKVDAEIWITEVGRRMTQGDHPVTEQNAATGLLKIYTMALAQKIAQIQWFEGQDPAGEDQGFGLLNREGGERASYKSLKKLRALLGPAPKYLGWVTFGRDSRGYGFVFEGANGPALIAWMPAGQTGSISFAEDVHVSTSPRLHVQVKAGASLEVTDIPLFVGGLPPEFVERAKENATKNFPWGGDYSNTTLVSCEPGKVDGNRGIAQVGRADCPTISFPDGSSGILVQGDIGHPVRFYVHPSFASFQTRTYYIRATVRRVASGNVGMNLLYEVADSQGRSPYPNTGKWGGFTDASGWQTYTWQVNDACFSKMWGYDLVLRPEQSVPFAIGRLEVSTEPLK